MDVVEEKEEKSESKNKEEEEQMRKEKKERALLERRYKLPEKPAIVLHPSTTAKGGKFDCTMMSLSLLLDYRQEDNKEHSFEVSLFAEIFNEMLMRDFGFQIYKSIVTAPSVKKEEEKKKDDRKDKDDKRDKDKKEKDEKKRNGDATSPKRTKREEKEDKKESDDMDVDGEKDDAEEKEEDDKKDKGDEKKKKKDLRSLTTNPKLLLAFSYFDQNHCGYLTDKDTEEIIHTLGLRLSRAQIKKIIQKVMVRDVFKYRRLTDQEVDEDGKPISPDQEDSTSQKHDSDQLAKGNNESLRKLLELSGTKIEGASTSSDAKKDENPSFVSYKGSFLDIESLISRLEKSEKTRTTLENSLSQLNGELKSTKENLEEKTTLTAKLQGDLRNLRSDLDHQKKLHHSAEALNKDWQRAVENSKSQMQGAMNTLNNMLNKEARKEKNDPSKKDVKKEADDKEKKDVKKDSNDKEKKDGKKEADTKKETEEKDKKTGEKDESKSEK